MTALIVLGLVLSLILSWRHMAGRSMLGCGGGSSCEQVLNSRWSTLAGVPVSGLAAGAYLAMLVTSFFLATTTESSLRHLAWQVMLVLVGATVGSALWFAFVQKQWIGAFCPYCMAAHGTGLVLATLVMGLAVRGYAGLRLRQIMGMSWVGVALAGILALGQILITPPALYLDGDAQESVAVADNDAVPFIGPADANIMVTLLFDYQCPHCQQMHFMLHEVVRRYQGALAFVLCPSPLNGECNPYIPKDVDQYQDSCEMVRIGLTVWRANPEAFEEFELFMFTYDSGDRWQPRTLEVAQARAIELIGQEAFDRYGADPWIETYMHRCIEIYGKTIQGGQGGVPKLVYDTRWVIPEVYSADDLVAILQDSLGVPGSLTP